MPNRLISKSGHSYLRDMLEANTISKDEYDICLLADERDDPNIFLGYWTLRDGADQQHCRICGCGSQTCRYPTQHSEYWARAGLQLFQWQIDIMMGNIRDLYGKLAHTVIVSGGPGCGKSTLLAAATSVWCALNPGFITMYPAPTSEQNSAVLRELVKYFGDTRYYEVFLETKIKEKRANKPLAIRWQNGSTTELFTTSAFSGGPTAGQKNLGKEADFGGYDEAGIDQRFPVNFQVLGTRMRGTRADGSSRGIVYSDGRTVPGMLLISNPHPDNVAWDEFYSYVRTASGFAVIEVSTSQNKAITAVQNEVTRDRVYAAVIAQHGDIEDAQAIIDGRQSAIGSGEVFSKTAMQKVLDKNYLIHEYVNGELYASGAPGNYEFNIPPESGHRYCIAVDPGAGFAPRRNAPVIGVWDITSLNNCIMIGLYWGALIAGDPSHYLYKLAEWTGLYACDAGIDTTGPQYLVLGRQELTGVTHRMHGFGFAGDAKRSAQVIMRDDAVGGCFSVPHMQYFHAQMRNYTWADNKASVAQDLVSMLLVFATWRRSMVSGDALREIAKEQAEDMVLQRQLSVRHGGHSSSDGHVR